MPLRPPKRTLLRILSAGILAVCAANTGAIELVVIVSAKTQSMALDASQVADIFLGQTGYFPDGSQAIPVDIDLDSPLRTLFYQKIAAKSPALLKAYWSKMIFTGRGQPPQEIGTSTAVRKRVADNPSLIGYIDKAALDASVRVVLMVH